MVTGVVHVTIANHAGPTPFTDDIIVLPIDAQLTRRGKGMHLVLGDVQPEETDPELESLLRESFSIFRSMMQGDQPVGLTAKWLGQNPLPSDWQAQ